MPGEMMAKVSEETAKASREAKEFASSWV